MIKLCGIRPLAISTVLTSVATLLLATPSPASPDPSTLAPAAAQQPSARRAPSALSTKVLSAEQLAKRDLFAKRTGISAAALSGPWHIVNDHSDKCLTIYRVSTANEAAAVQYTCEYSAPYNEEWYFEDVYGTGVFWHIRNGNSGKCLTIYRAGTANDAYAVQYTCEYSAPYNEEWYFEDVYGTGVFWHIRNGNSGKCLTIYRASTVNDANAVQYTCEYSAPYNEEWLILY